MNRFLSAFIDHVSENFKTIYYNVSFEIPAFYFQGLKDLEYVIQERTLLEKVVDFEFDSNITPSML